MGRTSEEISMRCCTSFTFPIRAGCSRDCVRINDPSTDFCSGVRDDWSSNPETSPRGATLKVWLKSEEKYRGTFPKRSIGARTEPRLLQIRPSATVQSTTLGWRGKPKFCSFRQPTPPMTVREAPESSNPRKGVPAIFTLRPPLHPVNNWQHVACNIF
ncbi:hypothetical protein MTP99_007731 [Tenebrio molitor]|nr:hypothetical protein MTP99_007731 [Tenebrio molitor]